MITLNVGKTRLRPKTLCVTLRVVKRKPRIEAGRTLRRSQEKSSEKLARDRERLFLLEVGGTPERPIGVVSSSVVEAQALSTPCPRCLGTHDLVEHAAVAVHGVRLREARLRCRQCGSRRSLWFRLMPELSS